MALIKCKECGNEVSSKAETCPKCGARVARKNIGCGTLIVVLFLGLVIAVAFTKIFSPTPDDKPSVSPQSTAAPAARPVPTRLTCATATGIKTEVEGEYVPGAYTVNVTFIAKRPSKKEMDRILRDCVSVAIKRDDTKDIVGTAWLRKREGDNPNDDDMIDLYGSQALIYLAASKELAVRDVKLTPKNPGPPTAARVPPQPDPVDPKHPKRYQVTYEVKEVPNGKRATNVNLIYPHTPAVDSAYTAATAEVARYLTKNEDSTVGDVWGYAMIGDSKKPAGWEQVRDPQGGWVAVFYDRENKAIVKNLKDPIVLQYWPAH